MVVRCLNSVAASLSVLPLLAASLDQPHRVAGIGIVVRGGMECPHVALEDGNVYALDGLLPTEKPLVPGTRIRIIGAHAPNSKCTHVQPLSVEQLQILVEPPSSGKAKQD